MDRQNERTFDFGLALATALAAASLGCAPLTMPLPPELQNVPAIVTASGSRVVVMGKVKPPKIQPYVFKDLETGRSPSRGMSAGGQAFGTALGFDWRKLDGGLSFRLEKEGAEGTTLSEATCAWGVATTSGGFSTGAFGAEFKLSTGSTLLCEFVQEPGAEPWRLVLWTGAPSNVIYPEFPSGGVLERGDVRYEAASTNVVEPPGLRQTYMTGTLFKRENQPVAAVERVLPGRILVLPSVTPEERSLFVAVGAAILVYDTQTYGAFH